MTNYNYIQHEIFRGEPLSKEDIYVMASAIARQFLRVTSLYDVEGVSIELGSFCKRQKRAVLDLMPPWSSDLTKGVSGTFYADSPEGFGPVEINGVHYTEAKPRSNDGEYAEPIECVIMREKFSELFDVPAKRFCISGSEAITYYFSGDGRLVYLPRRELKKTKDSLGRFTATSGQTVEFDLMWQKHALRRFQKEDGGDMIPFYHAGKEQPWAA